MTASAKVAAVVTLAMCIGSGLHAQPSDWKAWLDTKGESFSGVVLVGRGDAIVAVAAYGLADRATARVNTAETRFNLGSIGKTFTAIAIAQLIQQGRLSLDDSLAKVLPEYPNEAAAATITIRDLVAHRSGVAPFMRADFGDRSVAEMVKMVGAEPQVFAPGTRQAYSNGGYIVLGRVVEVVSGKSYADYLADHIYGPAGMTQSGFVKSGEKDVAVALGYFSADAQGRPMMGARGAPAGRERGVEVRTCRRLHRGGVSECKSAGGHTAAHRDHESAHRGPDAGRPYLIPRRQATGKTVNITTLNHIV